MTADPFFSSVKEWSRWKHRILEKYLYLWCRKLGSTSKLLAFVDGCAGEGRYGDGTKGSPLIAAEMNLASDEGKNWRLIVAAIEKNPTTCAKLLTAMAPWLKGDPPIAAVFPGSFEDAIATLEPRLHGVPTLYFIDPYSVVGLTPRSLAPILDARREKTELVFRYDPMTLQRLEGWLSEKSRSPQERRVADSCRRRLEGVGVDVAARMAAAAGGKLPAQPIEEEYLAPFIKRFRYVQLIPIRQKITHAPKYWLFHGTDNAHGAAHMNDIVGTTEDEVWKDSTLRAEMATGQGSLFNERPTGIAAAAAEAFMLKSLAAKPLQWIELRAELAIEYGTLMRKKDHREHAVRLQKRGALQWADAKLDDATIVRVT